MPIRNLTRKKINLKIDEKIFYNRKQNKIMKKYSYYRKSLINPYNSLPHIYDIELL